MQPDEETTVQEPPREAAVMFAELVDADTLDAIAACHDELEKAVPAQARVLKRIGPRLMLLAESADVAARAAVAMQVAAARFPAAAGGKPGVGIGFHFGRVIQNDADVFGDTVNLAARLVGQAGKGQIITSNETMEMLGPVYKAWTRRLYSIQVKGKTTEVELCEVLWRQGADTTALVSNRSAAKPKLVVLRLRYRDRDLIRRREQDSITIGRDQNAGLVIADTMASRLHCTIERRHGKFVLADHSTNGTYVTAESEAEILLQREEFTLGKHGWIACGQPRAATNEIVEYFCD